MIGMSVNIIEDWGMVDLVEDWSGARSPSRAARRRKRGFPQRIKVTAVPKRTVYQIGNKFVMHPDIAAEYRRRLHFSDRLTGGENEAGQSAPQ